MTRPTAPPFDLLAVVNSSRVLAPNTKRGYVTAVKRWLAFAGTANKDWTPQAAEAFYASLLTGPDKVTVRTANTMMWGVSYALGRYAKLTGTVNPIDAVELGRVRKSDDDTAQTPLTYAQGAALLEACTGNDIIDLRDRAMAVIGLFTGMRRSSLIDINLDHVQVVPDVVFLTVTIKGGNRYPVPIHPKVWAHTRRYREALGFTKGPLFRSFKQTSMSNRKRPVGPALTPDGAYKALGARAKAAGIDDFHPHLLRHTLVTWCLMAEMPVDRIEVITGHKGNQALARRVYGSDAALAPAVVLTAWNAIAPKLGL